MPTLITKDITLDEAVAIVRSRVLSRTSVRGAARFSREDFHAFCERYPDVGAELLPDGSIELMSPQVLRSNSRENIVSALLTGWWLTAGRPGHVYGPNAGFTLPDGSIRSPDAAWVSPERLAEVPDEEFDTMARLVPDFVIEVTSKTDSVERAREKMEGVWMANGVRLAWLLDTREQRVFIYREGLDEVERVGGFDREIAAAVPVGFVLNLRELR